MWHAILYDLCNSIFPINFLINSGRVVKYHFFRSSVCSFISWAWPFGFCADVAKQVHEQKNNVYFCYYYSQRPFERLHRQWHSQFFFLKWQKNEQIEKKYYPQRNIAVNADNKETDDKQNTLTHTHLAERRGREKGKENKTATNDDGIFPFGVMLESTYILFVGWLECARLLFNIDRSYIHYWANTVFPSSSSSFSVYHVVYIFAFFQHVHFLSKVSLLIVLRASV